MAWGARPEHKPLITQCKNLIEQSDWEVKVPHCYREANQVVDKLANLGIGRELGVVSLYLSLRMFWIFYMQMMEVEL